MAVRDVVQAAAGIGGDKLYVEDVFSTYLYTGNGSTQTITNNIDLAGEGGLVWVKSRSSVASHLLTDSGQGISKRLSSNSTAAAQSNFEFTSWNSNGFSLDAGQGFANTNAVTYASWTFRKAPKFFDVVTWTGDDAATKVISHSLGSVPGCIIAKATSTTGNWIVYHRSVGATQTLRLNTTAATLTDNVFNDTTPTSTTFTVTNGGLNSSGVTYVAYLFAHDAGGFGLTGTDNVISCGSYTGNGSTTGPVVTLGYEPQWLLIKNASDISNWTLVDNMRGMSVRTSSSTALLYANLSNAEAVDRAAIPLATGFQINDDGSAVNTSGANYIYIAIRRGPMKTPESGTSVFYAGTDTTTGVQMPTGFNVDTWIRGKTDGSTPNAQLTMNRLRGANFLLTSTTAAEVATNNPFTGGPSNTFTNNVQGGNGVEWLFGRAPSFHDVVCYTGTGANTTFAHNLGVAPEMMIVKIRGVNSGGWVVYHKDLTNGYALFLNTTNAQFSLPTGFNSTAPTSSVFTVGTYSYTNLSANTFVNYLFASCPGVSKVGSYTGTGTTQQINCGFTSGARFVLIKRTDSTGDWYVWDSARGIVSGNDPYLLLNSTAAEVTSTDYIDPYSAGFEISSTAPAAINASGGSFVYLAIA